MRMHVRMGTVLLRGEWSFISGFNGIVGLSLLRYVTEYGHKGAVSAVVSHSVNGVRLL